jgi:putative flippase GtrA
MSYSIAPKVKKEFLLFLLVGGVNTCFGYLFFAFFIYLGFHYSQATLYATLAGVLFNFKTTGRIVFKNKNNSLIFRFLAIYAFLYIINLFLLKIGSFIINSMYINGAIAIVITAGIAFLLNKYVVFRDTSFTRIQPGTQINQ